ncbi:MAG: hypothetical protein EOM22_06915 [Gammaproteobacteria bacterium]|nr:hypothetical protein [Gammaproteobacteria bacterium]
MIRAAAFAAAIALTGCASYRVGPSDVAQLGDSATTWYAIYQAGAVEANPLLSPWIGEPAGMAALVIAKQALVWGVKQPWLYQPGRAHEGCRSYTAVLFGAGTMATINNAGVILLGSALSWWAVPVFAAAAYGHYRYLSEWECAHLKP